ncbi:MAG: glycosyltransferase family 9 protein [Burkholderiaceae bacterium]|nr:glycosyltransferase family 9 protein [Burkholderiaceae bacterium]
MTAPSPSTTLDPDAPVVVRFAALGDVVLLTVLLAALAQRYGRPVHLLSSGDWTPVLLGHDPAVSELRLVSSRRAPYWLTPSQWSANAWLKAHRGPVYLCDPDEHAERVIRRAGIPESRLVRAWKHWPGDGIHWADWWLQIAALDAPACPGPAEPISTPPVPRLAVPEAWLAEARPWMAEMGLGQGADARPFVLFQPGHKKTHKRGRVATAGHDKHWPAERWAEVIRGVLADLPGGVALVCGSAREAGLAQEVVDAVGPPPAGTRVINIAQRNTTLPRLVALAAQARAMVSVDTGPAHVAAALDCPLVVLYGGFGWRRWRARPATSMAIPLGPEAPTDGAKVMDLSPDQVLAAWRRLPLRGQRSPD